MTLIAGLTVDYINEYRNFISKTLAPAPIGLNEEATLVQLLHAALGIAGEELELLDAFDVFNDEGEIEERGDLFYYIFTYINLLEVPTNFLTPENLHGIWLEQETDEGYYHNLLDKTKKYVFYQNHEINLTHAALALLWDMIDETDIEISEILNRNYEKLSRRYASGSFSTQEAKERADKQ